MEKQAGMQKITNNISNEQLAEILIANGNKHKSYKVYTSMERALQYFLTGYIYLTDGCRWNDIKDSVQMKQKNVYATCFSYSVKENVAMWMLYGDKCGRNGAIINLLPSSAKSILTCETLDVIEVSVGKKDKVVKTLYKSEGDFELYFTDIIYTNELENNKLRITYSGGNYTVLPCIVDNPRIFIKKYEWNYENECRLVASFSDDISACIDGIKQNLNGKAAHLEIRLTDKTYRKLGEDRLIRSPLYKGKISYGTESTLTGDIDWNIGNY